jgi:hypothetical protein
MPTIDEYILACLHTEDNLYGGFDELFDKHVKKNVMLSTLLNAISSDYVSDLRRMYQIKKYKSPEPLEDAYKLLLQIDFNALEGHLICSTESFQNNLVGQNDLNKCVTAYCCATRYIIKKELSLSELACDVN